jgi:hypothetical protein
MLTAVLLSVKTGTGTGADTVTVINALLNSPGRLAESTSTE